MVDIEEIRKKFDIHELVKKKLAEIEKYDCSIYCCHSTGCKSSGSDGLIALAKEILEKNNLTEKVRIVATGCMGLCAQGPLIRVEIKGKKDILFKHVDIETARVIMEKYVIPGISAQGDMVLADELKEHVLSLDTKQEKLGSIMGSGGMIAIDDSSDIVSLAKFYLDFTVAELCGKCAPCRIGGRQMLLLLDKINRGRGKKKDLEQLKKIAFAMQKASLCGLGQTTPNPVLSTLRFYEDEYINKLLDGKEKE